MRLLTVLALALAAFAAGCGPVISKEVLKGVDRGIAFREVAGDPEAYIGRSVVFGGTILKTENTEGGATVIEVLQEGLNSQLKPVDTDSSEGRFLAEFEGFKDPAIYAPGKGITVAGKVIDADKRPLGKGTYTYPVIRPAEAYLWERGRGYGGEPSIGIGIGLGFGYTHID